MSWVLPMLGWETVPEEVKNKSFYELKAEMPGKKGTLDFATLKGKVVLIVNTASKCGYTPQYTGLEKLHEDFHARGLEVLGFPSAQFANQEHGSDEQIAEFCTLNHGVTFPLMKKSDVNGAHMNEVFAWLKCHVPGEKAASIKWNFTKFLVNRQGEVVKRYGPGSTPEAIKGDIEGLL